MKHLWTLLVLVAAAINLAPVLGAVAPERMTALYGVDLRDPNLQILMRHRAVLFGLVGGLLLVAAFHPPLNYYRAESSLQAQTCGQRTVASLGCGLAPALRTLGYAVGFSSMLSFLLIAWLVGEYGAEIRRVILVDVVGIAALAGAGLVHAFRLRTAATQPQ